MSKVVHCNKVDPSSDCDYAIRGETVEEVLRNAEEHAKQHGLTKVTPELRKKIEAAIEDE